MTQKFRFILLILSSVLLYSCAGSASMKPDGTITVNGPMMARADKLALAVKKPDGTTFKFYIVNGNAEAVPIEGFRTAAALGLGLGQLSVTKADNASKSLTTQQANQQAAALATQKQADATAIEVLKLTPAP